MAGYDGSKDFRTKLSLPKFLAVTKRLTRNQKKLVADIGLEQLLYVTCEYLPRSLIAFLVANFDSQTRSLSLLNGPPVKLNASCINKVLGTPIGGLCIGKKVDPHVRTAIADLTNCKGHYPTISELDNLMTSELDGDTFKIMFTMYAMTAFLCPSSHDAISPDYLHIVENPGEISAFDFSSAVLLKLVSSIEAYNGGTTCVLGGNLFCLMAVYFEFLDTDLILSHVKCNVPRISIWSSSLVSEIEMLDYVCKDKGIFGSLPVKAQVPLIISKMQKDIMGTIQPVLVQNVMSLLSLTSGTSPMLNTDEKCKDHSGSVGFKVPSHGFSVCHTPAVQSNTIPPVICIPGQAASSNISDVVTMSDVDCEKNEHVCNDGCLLPVPGDDILDRCTEDAIKDGQVPDIHSIISAMEALHSPSSLGQLPCNFELLEQMNPGKPDFTQYDDSASSGVDILQYVKDQDAEERKVMVAREMQSPVLFEKVHFSVELDSVTSFRKPNASGSPCNQILSSNKRNAIISSNDFVSESACLIKRPRMFEINKESAVQSMDPGGIDNTKETCFNDGDPSFMSPSNSRIAHTPVEAPETSYSWDESEFDRELLRTTLQAEAEHESKLRSTQFPSYENQAFNVTEISPNKVISVFNSTLVEQDVFKDIVHRVPKTAKSKTINIVRMGSTWAEHRVFALSMQVYGNVNKYVINMLGKVVIVEDTEKRTVNLLPEGHWKRYFIPCDESALFAKPYENPGTLSRVISHDMIGFKIDSMDLVHVQLMTSGFYYLLLINFQLKLFEVLYPNTKFKLVSDHVEVAIKNFKMAFNLSYKHSVVKVDAMQTIYRSVCSSGREYVEEEVSNHSNDMIQEEEVSNQSTDMDQEAEVTSHNTKIRKFVAHMAEIEVVYTDDLHKAAEIVDMYEQWLSKDEYKFMGLDFEYCDPEYEGEYRIAVVQLAMKNHVLVYQWSSSEQWCPKLMDFLRSGVHFASVDIRNDKIAMKQIWNIEIPSHYHIDLQDLFKLERDRTGMADMAASLIDKSYKGMKKEFPSVQHKFWEKNLLDEINLEYAARDGFVAYELYRIIRLCNYGQRHLLPPLATPTAVQPTSTSGINASSSSSSKGKELAGTKRSRGDEGWTYTRITDGHENWSAAAWGFCTYDQTSPSRFPGDPWAKWPEEKKPKIGWSGDATNTP
ncbi:hypothetical protein ACQ4PT_013939 [Festuca glaucescens]